MRRIGWFAAVVAVAITLGAPPARGEEGTAHVAVPVTGQGFFFETGVNQAHFLGALHGPVYIESGPETLDGARIVCVANFALDTMSPTFTAQGSCTLGHGDEHKIFARWSCAGAWPKGCRGRMTITGGTGRFAGITGEGEGVLRTTKVEFIEPPKDQRAGIGVVRQIAEGLLTLPSFRYRIP